MNDFQKLLEKEEAEKRETVKKLSEKRDELKNNLSQVEELITLHEGALQQLALLKQKAGELNADAKKSDDAEAESE